MSNIFKIRFFCVVMFVLFLGLLIIQLSQPLSYGQEYTYVKTEQSSSTDREIKKITYQLYFYKHNILIKDSSISMPEQGYYEIIKQDGHVKELYMNPGFDTQKFNPFVIINTIYNKEGKAEEIKYICKEAITEFVIYVIGILGAMIGFLYALTIKSNGRNKYPNKVEG